MPARLVLDASVVIKWYVAERHSREAVQLKDWILKASALAAVPDLFYTETANIIWKKASLLKEITKIESQEIFREMMRLPFHVMSARELLKEAFHLSARHSIPIYDSVYLAAASELDAAFVTADEALAAKVSGTPVHKTLVTLSDWESRLK